MRIGRTSGGSSRGSGRGIVPTTETTLRIGGIESISTNSIGATNPWERLIDLSESRTLLLDMGEPEAQRPMTAERLPDVLGERMAKAEELRLKAKAADEAKAKRQEEDAKRTMERAREAERERREAAEAEKRRTEKFDWYKKRGFYPGGRANTAEEIAARTESMQRQKRDIAQKALDKGEALPAGVVEDFPDLKKTAEPPVTPSVERYEEIQREVSAIQKSKAYAEDTREGRKARDRALELQDESLIHRDVAMAKYQADIDAEKAAREAKDKPKAAAPPKSEPGEIPSIVKSRVDSAIESLERADAEIANHEKAERKSVEAYRKTHRISDEEAETMFQHGMDMAMEIGGLGGDVKIPLDTLRTFSRMAKEKGIDAAPYLEALPERYRGELEPKAEPAAAETPAKSTVEDQPNQPTIKQETPSEQPRKLDAGATGEGQAVS